VLVFFSSKSFDERQRRLISIFIYIKKITVFSFPRKRLFPQLTNPVAVRFSSLRSYFWWPNTRRHSFSGVFSGGGDLGINPQL
jgi:hypothetical protein